MDGPAAWPWKPTGCVYVLCRSPSCVGRSLRAREDVVAGPAGRKLRRQQILPAIAGGQRARQPLGDVGLATTEHVAHLLCVGVQAKVRDADVAVQHVAALNHAAVAAERRFGGARRAGGLAIHVGREPGRQAQVGEPLADVPLHVSRRGGARRDDAFGKRFGDHATRDGDHVRVEVQFQWRARLQPADAQASPRWPCAPPGPGPTRP